MRAGEPAASGVAKEETRRFLFSVSVNGKNQESHNSVHLPRVALRHAGGSRPHLHSAASSRADAIAADVFAIEKHLKRRKHDPSGD